MAKVKHYAVDDFPEAGSVFAFRLRSGEFAACRVVRILEPDPHRAHYTGKPGTGRWQGACALVVTTKFLSKEPPTDSSSAIRENLWIDHHAWTGKPETWLVDTPVPKDFQLVTNVGEQDTDGELPNGGFGDWDSFLSSDQILRQHEWDTLGKEEVLKRDAAQKAEERKKNEEAKQAKKNQLANLDLPTFANQEFFASWESLHPAGAVKEARELVRKTILKLSEMPLQKEGRMNEIKSMLESFNALQQKHQFIETDERDDICIVLGELFSILRWRDDPAVVFERWEDL